MAQISNRLTRKPGTANDLRKVAQSMLPFYKKIACSREFAKQWSSAVVKADLGRMGRLLSKIPSLANNEDYGTNAIGYFISFPFHQRSLYYTNGTTIPPGLVQFTFNTKVHRSIARSVLPLYRKLAVSGAFARSFAGAIRRQDTSLLTRMVRRLVPTRSLKSIRIENAGVVLLFKTRFSSYPYRNLLIRDVHR